MAVEGCMKKSVTPKASDVSWNSSQRESTRELWLACGAPALHKRSVDHQGYVVVAERKRHHRLLQLLR